MKQDPQPDLCCRRACTELFRGRGSSLRCLQHASSMTAHQHFWGFLHTTTQLLAAVQRLPTQHKEHSRSTLRAEQSQQSSWDSQASLGAGRLLLLQDWCLVAALTPEQSPHLRPAGRAPAPKLSSLSLLRDIPVCAGAFKQSSSVEGNFCGDACEGPDGTLASARKSGKQAEYPWIPA